MGSILNDQIPNLKTIGLSLREGVTSELKVIFDPLKRTVVMLLVFGRLKKVASDTEQTMQESIKIDFEKEPLISLNFSDFYLDPPDPGCVISLPDLANPSMDTSFGEATVAFVDMKRIIENGITCMVERNSTVIVDLVNQDEQLATDSDTAFKIRFRIDGGWTGKMKTICPLAHTRERGLTLRDNVSGRVYPNPLEFFEIPVLENYLKEWADTAKNIL